MNKLFIYIHCFFNILSPLLIISLILHFLYTIFFKQNNHSYYIAHIIFTSFIGGLWYNIGIKIHCPTCLRGQVKIFNTIWATNFFFTKCIHCGSSLVLAIPKKKEANNLIELNDNKNIIF